MNHFSEDLKSYIITEPSEKHFWLNQISNEDGYTTSVTNVGHGTSRYIDENAIEAFLTEDDEKFIYLRDEESGTCWNVGEFPLMEKVDRLLCKHSMAYSTIETDNCGIEAKWTLFIPKTGTREVWILSLKNASDKKRKISSFATLKFGLGGYTQPPYYAPFLCTETLYDEQLNGIYARNANPNNPHEKYNGFLASSYKLNSYDGCLTDFYGTLGSPSRPKTLLSGEKCSGNMTTVLGIGAVLQNTVELDEGEEIKLYYAAGLAASIEEARELARTAFINPLKELMEIDEETCKKYDTLHTKTPDKRINQILNYWTLKQVEFSSLGKKAVRDNAQIAMAQLNYIPQKAEQTITECISHQYNDGHAPLQFYSPILYSDPHMWLVLATCELVKETGNKSFLQKEVAFHDGGSATVYKHLCLAMEYIMNDLGEHGLPLIHYADWNDALNIDDEKAETVFVSMGLAWAQKEMSELCRFIGENDYADYLMAQREELVETINRVAWDGEWYVRALSRLGTVGSKESKTGGNIYVNPQVWSILADVVPQDRLEKVLSAIDGMDTKYGIPLCSPAYPTFEPHVGRMSGMLPGLFENGGVYNHCNAFKIMADCKVGRAEQAIATLGKMIPDSEVNPSEVSGAEPYIFVNCWGMHPSFYTHIWFSWFTGTSAWALRDFYEGICGLKRDYEGLKIEPCIPESWNEVEADRNFRGCQYHIVIKREGLLEPELQIDGVVLESNWLPVMNDGKVHNVILKI